MKEPFLSRFREMIRLGAAVQDIHDAADPVGYAAPQATADDAYIEREIDRVQAHQSSLLPLLEHFVGKAPSILDVGCSSGGTTVALALSAIIQAELVIGVDPNKSALDAARVRLGGYDLPPGRVRFETVIPNDPLPFSDSQFDLVTCVSVLEFISEKRSREFLASDLQRVTRPGGYVFLATPSPWRLREFHSNRVFGHFRHQTGYPWSSTPSAIRASFRGCEQVPVSKVVVRNFLDRHGIPAAWLLNSLYPLVAAALPWQRHLFRKPRERSES